MYAIRSYYASRRAGGRTSARHDALDQEDRRQNEELILQPAGVAKAASPARARGLFYVGG